MNKMLESIHERCHYERRRAVGEVFSAKARDAEVLVRLKRARYSVMALSAERAEEEVAAEEITLPAEAAPPKRAYRRRDLRAQS